MKRLVFPDYPVLSRATADLIRDYIRTKPTALICLASGFSPVGTFQCLIEDVRAGHLDIRQCRFVSLDEWVGVVPTDEGSCIAMLQRDFFQHLPLTAGQVEFFDVTVPDLAAECARINALVADAGGLDVMLVGIGTNGHIGMNEPGTPFDTYAHVGQLAEETISVGQKYFAQATELSLGLTMGLRHLQEAKLPILVASGVSKAAIVAKALSIEPTEELPASILQTIEQAMVMLDAEAANT